MNRELIHWYPCVVERKDEPFLPDTNTPTIRLGNSEEDVIDLPPHLRLEPGDQVGHYRIISLVAEGGFGIVYLAEQHTPVRRRVALKIIKPGMDTLAVITRFEAERQALAILDHPGIATVYDAGATDDGRPFFVMEYVEGEPITEYCDEHRLDTTQRLHLMIEVCAAVQHAHTKGIIHRDLKPSNIIVSTDDDGNPRPKVIDFGVAKATSMELTERSFCTETGQLIGTPEYMSPEQADLGSVDVDTRSDVYSLGMIIYEMVTGALPFESIQMREAGFSELCRIIQEEMPPKPSTRLISLGGEASKVATRRRTRPADLATLLRRELDWIPLKALRKDREERYESAIALADDIRRYINGDVLIAGPETSAYRLRKLLKRNRGGVLAAAFVFITLLAGLNVALVLLAETRSAQRDLTEQQSQREQVNRELEEAQITYMEALQRAEIAEAESRARAEKMERDLLYLQQATYTSNLHNARDALDAGDKKDARYRLQLAAEGRSLDHPFEWEYLWAQAEGSLAHLVSPGERLVRARVNPNSEYVFTMSPVGFSSWDAGGSYDGIKAEALLSLATPNQDPDAVLFAPDGKTALLGDPNGERLLVDTKQARIIATLPMIPDGLPTWVFSDDGRRIAHGIEDSRIRILDSRTARGIAEVSLPDGVDKVVLDTTGFRLAAIDRENVYLMNVGSTDSLNPPMKHDLDVTAAGFDSSGIRLATGTLSGDVYLWDVLTGRQIAKWRSSVKAIDLIRFSPNGNALHVGNRNDANAVLDLQTGQVLAEPTGAWSMTEDWLTLATSADPRTIDILSLDKSKPAKQLQVDSVTATSFSRRGDLLAAADSSGNLHIWDLTEETPSGVRIGHHDSAITDVFFADDDNRILAVSRDGPRIWSASGQVRVEDFDLQENIPSLLSFMPELPWLLNGTRDGDIMILDMDTGSTLAQLSGHDGEIVDLVYLDDESRLVSTSRDNTIRVWNLHTGTQMLSMDYSWWNQSPVVLDSVTSLLAVPDNKNNIDLVDVDVGEVRITLKGHNDTIFHLDFDPTGKYLASADKSGAIRIWELDSGTLIASLTSHAKSVSGLSFNSDGSRIVSSSSDGTVRIWNSITGQELVDQQIITQSPVMTMSISPDEMQIATGLEDGTVRTWSMATGDQLISLPTGLSEIKLVEWSPRGDVLLATGEDDSLRTWETISWKSGADLAGKVADLDTWDIDAEVDRIASVDGRNILLHDTHTGDFIFTLRDHDADVTQLAFSPDGNRLISTDISGRLKIWNTITESQAAERRQARHVAEQALSPLVNEWIQNNSDEWPQLEEQITSQVASRPQNESHAIRALVLKHLQDHEKTTVN
ncbi:MAG: protein kinase [Phycisphaerales bacterium]|nr:protein kinase [Phycisphaerales bacterium]